MSSRWPLVLAALCVALSVFCASQWVRESELRAELLSARVAELTAGEGVDRVIEVDIAANGMLDAEMLKPGGCAVVYGSGKAGFELPFFPLIVKNLSWHFFIVYALSPADRAAAERARDAAAVRAVATPREASHRATEVHSCV